MLRELKGEERAEGAGEMEKWRTARLSASTVLGVRAGRECHVEGPRYFERNQGRGSGEGAARGRAGGEMATP